MPLKQTYEADFYHQFFYVNSTISTHIDQNEQSTELILCEIILYLPTNQPT